MNQPVSAHPRHHSSPEETPFQEGRIFKFRAMFKLHDIGYVLGDEILIVAIKGFSFTEEAEFRGHTQIIKTTLLYKVRYERSGGEEWIPAKKVFKSRQNLLRALKGSTNATSRSTPTGAAADKPKNALSTASAVA